MFGCLWFSVDNNKRLFAEPLPGRGLSPAVQRQYQQHDPHVPARFYYQLYVKNNDNGIGKSWRMVRSVNISCFHIKLKGGRAELVIIARVAFSQVSRRPDSYKPHACYGFFGNIGRFNFFKRFCAKNIKGVPTSVKSEKSSCRTDENILTVSISI